MKTVELSLQELVWIGIGLRMYVQSTYFTVEQKDGITALLNKLAKSTAPTN